MSPAQTKLVFARISEIDKKISEMQSVIKDPNTGLFAIQITKQQNLIEKMQTRIILLEEKISKLKSEQTNQK